MFITLPALQHVTVYDPAASDAAWYLKCYSNGRYRRYRYLTHVMLAPGDLVAPNMKPGMWSMWRHILPLPYYAVLYGRPIIDPWDLFGRAAGGNATRVAVVFSTERLFVFKSPGPNQKFKLVC